MDLHPARLIGPKLPRSAFLAILAALVLSGCTSATGERPRFPKVGDLTSAVTELFESDPQSKDNPTAEALYKDGTDFFERGRYARSISFFQKLRDEYPFSKEAEAAELKIAEAYFRNEEYVHADETYKNYLTFQPTGRHIHHVKYQLGLVNLAQFTGVDRDLDKVKEASRYFASVIKDHPASEHVADARKKLAETRVHLAEREIYIGNHYLKEGRYPAARERFETVLSRYPDTPPAAEARAGLARIPADAAVSAARPAPVEPEKTEPGQFVTKSGYEYEAAVSKSWYDYLNPFSRDRGGEEAEEPARPAETAAAESRDSAEEPAPEEEEKRSWWSRLNPFSRSGETPEAPVKAAPAPAPAEAASATAVVEGIDKTLGSAGSPAGDAPVPPVSKLPAEEKEEGPVPTDPAKVLGEIDARLGGEAASGDAPRAPASDPALFTVKKKPKPDTGEAAADEPKSVLLERIDRELGRQGGAVELPKPPASP